MSKYVAVYKCRLCGEIFYDSLISEEAEKCLMAFEKGKSYYLSHSGRNNVSRYKGHYYCKDGSLGVADFQGFRKWPMLESDRLDSVGEQISVTQEREKKYTFSTPYAYNVYCLLAAKDNEKLKSMEDLATGMTISCETNTSDEIIVNAINKEYGIELEPTYYDGMSVQDVALGRCDLWPRAETSCNTTVKEVDNLKILGKTDILETNAYPFAKTERGEELAKVVSEALDGMREDGTLKTLSEKWFDIDISEKPADAQ